MNQIQIDRINALARKAKAEGLTPEETAERDELRRQYVAAVKASLTGHLDNTYLVDEKGNKRPLPRKDRR
ncbi:MAG: DUF896 domain-containing protein [Oscillospiraceae bacterium]|jgi:uncharacterized protein YnzC (UPF0291/DUF896 family)|nr:DUF896 domain-containing protein [Oscillospiraceae bacterium]